MSSENETLSCPLVGEGLDERVSSDIAIRVQNVSKCYHIYDRPEDRLKQSIVPRLQRLTGRQPKNYFREFWALKDISFEVKKGETIGIIGRNGTGKSTLLQIICGTLAPTSGSVETNGRIAALLELGSGFNHEFTGRENVYMNGAVLGLRREEIDARFDDIAAFADIGEFIEQPVKTYSSGMLVRLAFSVSVCVDPEILIVDEALAVGDIAFQQKCLQRLADLREAGTTILLVSHDIMLTRNYCGRAIYLQNGSIRQMGDPEAVGEAYLKDLFAAQQQGNSSTHVEWRRGPGKLGFGNSNGRITSVSCLGGNASGIFRQKDVLAVSVVAEIGSHVRNPELVAQVRDVRGYVLYGLRTSPEEICKSTNADGEETLVSSVFNFRIELAPGSYAISIGLNDRHGDAVATLLDKAIAVVVFSVVGQDSKFHGCINLYGCWDGSYYGRDGSDALGSPKRN